MATVQILLSTYNGAKYLEEQIESLLNQTHQDWNILIRDDGSSDETVTYLDSLKNQYPNIDYYVGKNIGSCASYFDLMWKTDISYDYYAFADQDDYWLPNKLTNAINLLNNENSDIKLYCGSTILVDEYLKPYKDSKNKSKKRPSFGNALIENIASGCTMVFSKELLQSMRSSAKPSHAYMHDWWMYLYASSKGTVIIDYCPQLLYRQHNENVIGNATTFFDRLKRRVSNVNYLQRIVCDQAEEFAQLYSLTNIEESLLNEIIDHSIIKKTKMVFDKRIYRQSLGDTLLYKLLILTWF